jgi:hypothetical protein
MILFELLGTSFECTRQKFQISGEELPKRAFLILAMKNQFSDLPEPGKSPSYREPEVLSWLQPVTLVVSAGSKSGFVMIDFSFWLFRLAFPLLEVHTAQNLGKVNFYGVKNWLWVKVRNSFLVVFLVGLFILSIGKLVFQFYSTISSNFSNLRITEVSQKIQYGLSFFTRFWDMNMDAEEQDEYIKQLEAQALRRSGGRFW